jgi:pre-mRNA-splicing factor ISY1
MEEGDLQMGGYRYFGAAKDLPGVKELLAQEEAKRNQLKPVDLHRNLTPDYFGWGDEEDGVLLELESLADKKRGVKRTRRDAQQDHVDEEEDYLQVPSRQAIEKALLEHKKKALLDRFGL